jgi:Fur family transcriptional regulator, ferric uptake regulator
LQLQSKAAAVGIKLSLIGAYRVLRAFKESKGKLENSESNCLRVVASILKGAPPGVHMTATEILLTADASSSGLHKSTVYRVLSRLVSIGLITAIEELSVRSYEWKRDDTHHGHMTCVKCGQTVEFHQNEFQGLATQICARLGYEFTSMEFTIRSLCKDCRQ